MGAYNQPLNNTTTIVYDLPFGKGRRFGAKANAFLEAVFGGWRGTMINTMGSGLPVNLNYTPLLRYSVANLPTYRPNLLGDPMAPKSARNIDKDFNKVNVAIPC